jgi:uncharacterized protein (DUF849 family)
VRKIINYTPTGTLTTRQNSRAPLQPNEIIEDVHAAYEEGITVTHIHARDKNDNNTYYKSVYEQIISGIRRYCPGLSICVSLSGRFFNEFEQRSEVLELYPDMGSLTMSSLNFPQGASINSPEMILRLLSKMETYGVNPEIECFDSGMLNYAKYLIDKQIIKKPFYINLIGGNLFNAQSDLISIAGFLTNLPKEAIACFGGIGKDQLRMNMLGLIYADGIRIGLEDNLYYDGKIPATNMELLKRIRRVMKEMNMEVFPCLDFNRMGFGNQKKFQLADTDESNGSWI